MITPILQYSQDWAVYTGLSSASESVQSWNIVRTFWLTVVEFKFLLFFTTNNWLVTLEIAPTAFEMQPSIFCVFRPMDLVFDWSILLQIIKLYFLIFKGYFF